MEHQKADVRPVVSCGASGDDAARFLRELRQLRNGAGLGHAELAARAHYPYDSIRAAEVGPSLPDLPVLSAFVRGCGGTTEEWEERWRSLTKSPSLPLPSSRQSGQSDAATAGARISSAAQAVDSPDPSVIIAALNRVAEEMAGSGEADAILPPPAAQPSPRLASSPRSPDTPETGGKPGGWDPIRVSAAWPALKHTPTIAEPARDAQVLSGVGVPWEAGMPAADGTPASAASRGAVSLHGAGRVSRTAIVAAVILLCVLAVLLAIFAL